MPLISLVYVSLATHPLTDPELAAILATARDFNSQNEITGMLLYRDQFFIQALEGEADTVTPLFEKIGHDPRHKNVLMVYKTEIDSRSFEQWSMGFNMITDEAADQLPGFNDFLQEKHDMAFFTSHPSRATLLLELFKDHEYF